MTKSQFNIKISKDLLVKVKRQAMMSGKSLTEHITELITNSLNESDLKHPDSYLTNRINDLQERLLHLESIVSNREYISNKLKPFTNSEAINCTKFMKGVFDSEVRKKKYDNKNKAFDDFFHHLKAYIQSNQFPSDRLKEIMIEDNATPWTGKELNDLSLESKCNCPIRKGLINWTGKIDCPSQQEICEKGESLLPLN